MEDLGIKTPKASRALKQALLHRQLSVSEAGPPPDQILDLHLIDAEK